MNKTLLAVAAMALSLNASAQISVEFSSSKRGPLLGDRHYGIFYEEINHAGDGGIYAELVRNGSIEEGTNYWSAINGASMKSTNQRLLNSAQQLALAVTFNGSGSGVANQGYWGMNFVKGETYKASFWIRTSSDWKGNITVSLLDGNTNLGSASVAVEGAGEWKKFKCEIVATGSAPKGRMALTSDTEGSVDFDLVSLFPPTYKNRENGMRRDLAEKLEALHPAFVRFPGGCYIEGEPTRYEWKNSIGPIEERVGIEKSMWGYPVSNGMGFHEFLQLTEDLGAEPLFVINVGLAHTWYCDISQIEGFIQEAMDAIEYCNGGTDTYWGKKRAENGHPEPFNMRLIEIGNENYQGTTNGNRDRSDHYPDRYNIFSKIIKAKYPDMICIGNVEAWGTDNPSWRNSYPVDMVDEHYYRSPDWFAGTYNKYDTYSRTSHTIYVGEYAVTSDFGTNGHLKAALGEAIYMAGMERNSDVVEMTSYAPIFINENDSQWRPDMIHYNSAESFGTPSYWAQQMMAANVGYQNVTWNIDGNDKNIYICAALTQAEDSVIVKIVNYGGTKTQATFSFEDAEIYGQAHGRVMAANNPLAENTMSSKMSVAPVAFSLDDATQYEIPAYSLSVLRMPVKNVSAEVHMQPDANLPTATIVYDFEQGKPCDKSETYEGNLFGGALIETLSDGNKVLNTGAVNANGYFDMGNSVAGELAALINSGTYSASIDIFIEDHQNLGSFCWAWNVSNGTRNYAGLINKANNGDWYYEPCYNDVKKPVYSSSGLRIGEWHNITITAYDGQTAIYVDGENRAERYIDGGTITADASTVAWLGKSPYSADKLMTGICFDNLEFYDKALSPEQVLALYNRATEKGQLVREPEPVVEPETNSIAELVIDNGTMVDITKLLENADFAFNSKGWNGTMLTAAPGTVAEQFDKAFDTYQVLENMPAGVYMIEWQGFYRNGNKEVASLRHQNGDEHLNSVVYAASQPAGSDFLAPLTTLSETPIASLYSADGFSYSAYSFPDNVTSANSAFSSGKYAQKSQYFTLPEMANLRIGIRKDVPCPKDWTCFDNFKLWYVGPVGTTEPASNLKDIISESANNPELYYTLGGTICHNLKTGIYIKAGKLTLVK